MRFARSILVCLSSILLVNFSVAWVPSFGGVASPRVPANAGDGQTSSRGDNLGGENVPVVDQQASDNSPSDEDLEAKLGVWDERVPQFNTLHLTGRVGNNPEPRNLDGDNVVVNLSLACQRNYHNMERQTEGIKGGEEETDWYGLEIWGRTAEFVSKYVEKGTRIGVIGTLQIDTWQDKAGEKQLKAKCIVRELEILETKAEAEARRSSQRGTSFFTSDKDEDLYDPSRGNRGGFFDA